MTRMLTFAVLSFLSFATSSRAQDWPGYRGPDHDGTLRKSAVFDNPFELRHAWTLDLGASYSGITAADGAAILLFSDGASDFVAAFELTDGSERWRVRIGDTFPGKYGAEDGPSSTPCVRAGTVFVPGPFGRFMAIGVEDGATLWSIDLRDAAEARIPTYGFGSSPLPLEEVVFLSVGAAGGGKWIGFDPSTGKARWTRPSNWIDYQSSVPLDAELVLASDASNVAILDALTGEEYFRFHHAQRGTDLAYPQLTLVDEDRVLFSYENFADLYDLDLTAEPPLTRVWSSRELKQSYSPPIVHDGAIYGMSGTFLVCVDLETGRRLWKSREPSARGLILVGDHLALLSSYGEVVVAEASPEGYREKARVEVTDRGGYTPPAFADGRILVRNTSTLSCVEVVPVEEAENLGAPSELALAGALGELVERMEASEEPDSVLDAWWAEQASFPIVEDFEGGSLVHFVYRGVASDVALIGDMTPDRGIPKTMDRIPGTDLFYRSYEYEPGGLWQYSFLVDFERCVTDPNNPERAQTISQIPGNPQALGYDVADPESILVMPEWSAPPFLEPTEGGGRLEEIPFTSPDAPEPRPLTVYLPEGFDEVHEGVLPSLYIMGGDGWLENGGLKPALDRMMGRSCARAIVILLPYHAGSRDRLDGEEYTAMVLNDALPRIQERYDTHPYAVMAAADDAAAAMTLAFADPERFGRVAVFSTYADPEDFALFEGFEGAPAEAYVDWSRYEPEYRDENTNYRAASQRLDALLRERGSSVSGGEVPQGPGWWSWSSRLDRALEVLLPLR